MKWKIYLIVTGILILAVAGLFLIGGKQMKQELINPIIRSVSAQEQVLTLSPISEKDLKNNSYQKIITPYIDFELPKQATHYWNPTGLDTYEVIIHNISIKGYTEKINKDRERWLAEHQSLELIHRQ
jgi:hypothetical protein